VRNISSRPGLHLRYGRNRQQATSTTTALRPLELQVRRRRRQQHWKHAKYNSKNNSKDNNKQNPRAVTNNLRACVCVCVHTQMKLCLCARVSVRVCVSACVCMCVCVCECFLFLVTAGTCPHSSTTRNKLVGSPSQPPIGVGGDALATAFAAGLLVLADDSVLGCRSRFESPQG
jgi:hypothetical protein